MIIKHQREGLRPLRGECSVHGPADRMPAKLSFSLLDLSPAPFSSESSSFFTKEMKSYNKNVMLLSESKNSEFMSQSKTL